jgi:Protein of unknown function (DUF2905)
MLRSIVIFAVAIVILSFAWPWLSRLGFGRLPGDFHVERNGRRYAIPVMSTLILSALLTLALRVFGR